MSIDRLDGHGLPNRPEQLDESKSRIRPNRGSRAGRSDVVQLSPEVRERAALAEAARRAPDVRQARVADLRQSVSDGTYRVDPQLVARAILEFERGFED